jgi:hypothetical protein
LTNNPHKNKISYSQSNQRVPKKDDKYGNIDNFTTVKESNNGAKSKSIPKINNRGNFRKPPNLPAFYTNNPLFQIERGRDERGVRERGRD